MSKIFEVLMHTLLGRQLLERLTKKAEEGGCAEFDVVLRRATEYFVKGKVLHGYGAPRLSLFNDRGSEVSVYGAAGGNYFTVIPEKDGIYRIRAEAGSGSADWRLATVVVTLSTYNMPGYAMLHIAAASGHPAEASPQETVPKGLPDWIA